MCCQRDQSRSIAHSTTCARRQLCCQWLDQKHIPRPIFILSIRCCTLFTEFRTHFIFFCGQWWAVIFRRGPCFFFHKDLNWLTVPKYALMIRWGLIVAISLACVLIDFQDRLWQRHSIDNNNIVQSIDVDGLRVGRGAYHSVRLRYPNGQVLYCRLQTSTTCWHWRIVGV